MKFQEFVDIAQIGQDVADQILPRQAIVTRAEGNGVWVRFAGPGQLTEPESWFVSTVAGLSAGSMGWVYMVHGGKGIFVATGQPEFSDDRYYTQAEVDALIEDAMPIPVSHHSGGSVHTTTSVGTVLWPVSAQTTIVIPAGTYRAVGTATMPMRRSVSTGNAFAYVRIGGQEAFVAVDGATAAMSWLTAGLPIDVTFTTTGSVLVEFGLDGRNTAGTTYMYRAAMSFTLTRI